VARGATTRLGERSWRTKPEEEKKPNGGWRARSQEGGWERGGEKIGGDLASVRGPTGRWNPRSRLIAIKAPLRLRLWIFYSSRCLPLSVFFPLSRFFPAPFLLVSLLALNSLYADSVTPCTHHRLHLETTRSDPFLVMRRTAPSLPPYPPTYPRVGGGTQFETSEFEYGRPGPETMGTSTDHTGCEQMVEQPRDMRSGNGCSFFSRPQTTHETTAGANYRQSNSYYYSL